VKIETSVEPKQGGFPATRFGAVEMSSTNGIYAIPTILVLK